MRLESRVSLAMLIVILTGPWAVAVRLPTDAARAEPGNAGIVGRVVDGADNQPVGEALVTVTTGAPRIGTGTVTLLTGTDGRFVIRDVPAGIVQVRVAAPGYLPGAGGQAWPDGPSRPIVIAGPGSWSPVTVRLWRPAVISGVVTDEGGAPVVGVAVRVVRRRFAFGLPHYEAGRSAQTDDRGAYRIGGLVPGHYIVVVPQTQITMPVSSMNSVRGNDAFLPGIAELAESGLAPGPDPGLQVGNALLSSASGATAIVSDDGTIAAYRTEYFPGVTAPDQATVVTLRSGEKRAGVDLGMPLVSTAAIAGTVVGPDGPAANMQLRVVPAEGPDIGTLSDVARGTTAADGSFFLLGVPAGAHLLKVRRLLRPGDARTFVAEIPLAVDRDISGLEVTVSAGAVVSGDVTFIGTAPAPMAGLAVVLTAFGEYPPRVTRVRVDADGRFATPGLMPGRYRIDVTGEPAGWSLASAAVNGLDVLEQPLEVAGKDIHGVAVTFVDRQTRLTGVVRDTQGVPAAANVLVFPADHRGWIAGGMHSRFFRMSGTRADGSFSVVGLPDREYLVAALAPEEPVDVGDPAVFDALARVARVATLSAQMPATVSVRRMRVTR